MWRQDPLTHIRHSTLWTEYCTIEGEPSASGFLLPDNLIDFDPVRRIAQLTNVPTVSFFQPRTEYLGICFTTKKADQIFQSSGQHVALVLFSIQGTTTPSFLTWAQRIQIVTLCPLKYS